MPTISPSASRSASAHTSRPPALTTRASARSVSIFLAFTGRMNRAKMSTVVIALVWISSSSSTEVVAAAIAASASAVTTPPWMTPSGFPSSAAASIS